MNKNDEGYWIEIFERDINVQIRNGHKLGKILCPITPEVGGSNRDYLAELFEIARDNVRKELRMKRIHKFIAFCLIGLILVIETVSLIYMCIVFIKGVLDIETLSFFSAIMNAMFLTNTVIVWCFSIELIKFIKKSS